MTPQQVDEVGQGRVWTGRQALERGLVDELGGLYAAARRAKRAIGLEEDDDVYLIPYPRPQTLSEQIFSALQSTSVVPASLFERRAARALPEPMRGLLEIATSLPTGSALLIPPALVEIR
jgi:protease-4